MTSLTIASNNYIFSERSINADEFARLESAGNIEEFKRQQSRFEKIWDKIADYFCSTNKNEARAQLLKLMSDETSNEEKSVIFESLKQMCNESSQHYFQHNEHQCWIEGTDILFDKKNLSCNHSDESSHQKAVTFDSHPLQKPLLHIQGIQQGNNNLTHHIGERILKSPANNMSVMLERSYSLQMKNWNEYYAGTGLDSATITEDGKLSTPFLSGQYPDDEQRAECIKQMYERGFLMEDCRDKRNFIVTQDGICRPVDFGQIYQAENSFYKVKLYIVSQVYKKITGNPLY